MGEGGGGEEGGGPDHSKTASDRPVYTLASLPYNLPAQILILAILIIPVVGVSCPCLVNGTDYFTLYMESLLAFKLHCHNFFLKEDYNNRKENSAINNNEKKPSYNNN